MLEPAILGALAAIDAGPVGLDHHAIDPARNHVGLTGEVGNPEAVDDVVGAQQQLDRLAGRQPQLVRRAIPRTRRPRAGTTSPTTRDMPVTSTESRSGAVEARVSWPTVIT